MVSCRHAVSAAMLLVVSMGCSLPNSTIVQQGWHGEVDGNNCTCLNVAGQMGCVATGDPTSTICELGNQSSAADGTVVPMSATYAWEMHTTEQKIAIGNTTCYCNKGALQCPCILQNGTVIPSGYSYNSACNACICDGSGTILCTSQYCGHETSTTCELGNQSSVADGTIVPMSATHAWELRTKKQKVAAANTTCHCNKGHLQCPCFLQNGTVVPSGYSYNVACNACSCDGSGMISCTEMACGQSSSNAFVVPHPGVLVAILYTLVTCKLAFSDQI